MDTRGGRQGFPADADSDLLMLLNIVPDAPHDIDCKIDRTGAMASKFEFVRKA